MSDSLFFSYLPSSRTLPEVSGLPDTEYWAAVLVDHATHAAATELIGFLKTLIKKNPDITKEEIIRAIYERTTSEQVAVADAVALLVAKACEMTKQNSNRSCG